MHNAILGNESCYACYERHVFTIGEVKSDIKEVLIRLCLASIEILRSCFPKMLHKSFLICFACRAMPVLYHCRRHCTSQSCSHDSLKCGARGRIQRAQMTLRRRSCSWLQRKDQSIFLFPLAHPCCSRERPFRMENDVLHSL